MTFLQMKTEMAQLPRKGSTTYPSFRILFLAPFAPHLQANHGGARVIAQLIAHLGQRHLVGLCYLRAQHEPALDPRLRAYCDIVEEIVIPESNQSGRKNWRHRLVIWKQLIAGKPLWAIDRFSPAFEKTLKTLLQTWHPDVVQIEFHVMGQYIPVLASYPAPRILVQHEPGVQSSQEIMQSPLAQGRIMPRLDLLAWKRFERRITKDVQAVVVFTERDRKAVRSLGQSTPIVQIMLGTDIPQHTQPLPEDEPLSILFVGNFKHLPNLDAADRLIHKIFPAVQSQFPEARLYIVGDHLPSELLQAANRDVILTGRVPDVAPYLGKAALVVVPLRLGGGMRVKVLEALAAGKAVVASSRAVEGLDLQDGGQVILAEEDHEFVGAIVDLLRNPDKRVLLGSQARTWASANLSWDRVAKEYEAIYHILLKC